MGVYRGNANYANKAANLWSLHWMILQSNLDHPDLLGPHEIEVQKFPHFHSWYVHSSNTIDDRLGDSIFLGAYPSTTLLLF